MKRLPFNHGVEDLFLACSIDNLKYRENTVCEILDIWEKNKDPRVLREAAIYLKYYSDTILKALPITGLMYYLTTPICPSEIVAMLEKNLLLTKERNPEQWRDLKKALNHMEQLYTSS